jgi:O-antigen/teichoic acid export membrane protein
MSAITRDKLAEAEPVEPPDSPGGVQPAALRRAAVRGGAAMLGSRLACQVLGSAITLLVARFVRPYDYGIVTAGGIVYILAEIMAEAGMGRALVQKPDLSDRDQDEAFTLSLGIALTLYAVLYGLALPVSDFMRSPDLVAFLRVTGLVLLLIPFRAVPLSLLDRRLQLGRQSVLGIAYSLTQGFVVLGLAWRGLGYWSFAAGVMAANLLQVCVLIKLTGWRPRLRWPEGGFNPLFAFGIQLSGARLCLFLYSNADYIVVGRLLGPVTLGYYSLAFMVISIPLQKLVSNCNQVAFPVFCRISHDRDRLGSWFSRLLVLIGSVGTPALVGVALVAPDAFPLVLGQKWAPAVLPLQIMCIAGISLMIGGTFDALFNALGRPDILFRYYLACLLIYPPCFYLVGGRWGVPGVALVWSLVCPVMVTSMIVLTRPITRFGLGELLRGQIPIWAANLFMVLIVLGVQSVASGPGLILPRLVLSIVAGAVAYGLATRALAWDSVMGSIRLLWREYAA